MTSGAFLAGRENLLKTLMTAVRYIWIFSAIVAGTAIGTIYGWERHGLGGALGFGLIGFALGATFANSPELVLELLVSIYG